MNALKNIGTKLAAAMIATGLIAGAAFAADSTVKVTLPEAVSLGGTTLASGQYSITETTLVGGASIVVFRDEKGDTTTAVAQRTAEPGVDQKTEVVLSHAAGKLHLDKMFIEGDSVGYQFADSK